MKIKLLNYLISFFIFTSVILGQTHFISDKNDSRNQAIFESNAPLEDIVGVSNKLMADITINLKDITNNPKGTVKVDLRELKTGIDLRDKHLRSSNWLDTDKFPYAEFELNGISEATTKELNDGKEIHAMAIGKLFIHGTTKEITTFITLTYYKENEQTRSRIRGNLLKVTTNFIIKLSDYGISIPSMVVGKVDENIKVSANFIVSDYLQGT